MAKYRDNKTGEIIDVPGAATSFMWGVDKTMRNAANALNPFDDFPTSPKAPPMELLSQEHPAAVAMGEMAPMMIPTPGGLAAQLAAGAGMGYLGADEGERGAGAAWGAAGGAVGHMVGRVISRAAGLKAQNLPSRGISQAAREASETGTPMVSLGEALDSDAVKAVETGIKTLPFGRAPYKLKGRQANINKQALDVFGLGDKFTTFGDDAIDAIKGQIKADFTAIERQIPTMDVPADLADDIRAYAGKAAKTVRGMDKRGVKGYTKAGEPMTDADGTSLMRMRSKMLDRIGKSEDTSDIWDSIDLLDDLIEGNTKSRVLKGQWKDARDKYRFYKMLDPSLNESNVSAAKLSRRMRDWRESPGQIGQTRKNVQALRSDAFSVPHGAPGTANQLLGILGVAPGAVMSPIGGLMNSAIDMGTIPTRYGAAAGRGLLSDR